MSIMADRETSQMWGGLSSAEAMVSKKLLKQLIISWCKRRRKSINLPLMDSQDIKYIIYICTHTRTRNTHTHTHTHLCIYTYMNACVCLYIWIFFTHPTKWASVAQGLFKVGPRAGPLPKHARHSQIFPVGIPLKGAPQAPRDKSSPSQGS